MSDATFLEYVVFFAAAVMMLGGAFGVIALRNPVHAALGLVLTLFGVAVQFVAMEAHFLAAVQVIVYAGAIVVLFLFVIMLVNLHRLREVQIFGVQWPLAAVIGVLFIALISLVAWATSFGPSNPLPEQMVNVDGEALGNAQAVAWLLYREYLLPFEIASLFLLVAMIGAVVLGRKE